MKILLKLFSWGFLFSITFSAQHLYAATPSVSAGAYHTLVLKDDGTVWAWGMSYFGQLGDGTQSDSQTPVQVKGLDGNQNLTDIIAIAAGEVHSIALKSDGTVWAWGGNTGKLGNNTNFNSPTPVQVLGLGGEGILTEIIAIAANRDHSVAIKSDGTVWAWGDNRYGQLGDNTQTNRSTPIKVVNSGGNDVLKNVTAIAVGLYHTLAIKYDGTI